MDSQEEIQVLKKQITELEFENAQLKHGGNNSNQTNVVTPTDQQSNAEKSKQAKERAEIFRNARIIGQD